MTEENNFDVIVVGAGISGIGSAYRLQKECPDRSFVILEGRPNLGGTWDLFRYPGIRSDSDMHTLGFSFKPWKAAKSIADGPAILEYLEETVDEFEIREKIKFNHHVSAAEWSNEKDCWTLRVSNSETGDISDYTCNFLLMCSGYYSYKSGYTPSFEGVETYSGQIVHPQEWPEDIDYDAKKIVVIGSGATAVTLVPAMAESVREAGTTATAVPSSSSDVISGTPGRPSTKAAQPRSYGWMMFVVSEPSWTTRFSLYQRKSLPRRLATDRAPASMAPSRTRSP